MVETSMVDAIKAQVAVKIGEQLLKAINARFDTYRGYVDQDPLSLLEPSGGSAGARGCGGIRGIDRDLAAAA